MQTNKQSNQNSWITPGILISCKHKRDLYTQLWNNNNNPITTSHYKILQNIDSGYKKAKCMGYDKLILNSDNKIKTKWNIINKEPGSKNNSNNIQALDVEGKKIIDQHSIAKTFNEYFVTITENIRKQIRYTHMHVYNNDVDNCIQFINHAFDGQFPNMENKYAIIKEIEQIINS
jgi:hypothetical protein